jgi:secretion/DNA translocation related TadE-like protein
MTRRSERGAASMILLGIVAVALVLCAALARLGGAAVSAARAQTAADAAALAAADQLALGHRATAAWRTADSTAHENGARLVSCRCSGVTAEVEIEIPGRARARARAEVDFSRALGP